LQTIALFGLFKLILKNVGLMITWAVLIYPLQTKAWLLRDCIAW